MGSTRTSTTSAVTGQMDCTHAAAAGGASSAVCQAVKGKTPPRTSAATPKSTAAKPIDLSPAPYVL
jgi:hypothetical protein